MKLTSEQIDHLYQFTSQHYVEYYDLQTELVDHLANAIEEQWKESPKISFEEALQKEFKKFGVFGFQNVVEQREVALNKKYNQMVWQQMKFFFKLPKIIGTVLSVVIIFYLLKQFRSVEYLIPAIMIVLMISFFIGLNSLARKEKMHVRRTEKRWMLHHIIFGYSSKAGYSFFVLQILGHFSGTNYADWTYWFVSVIFVLLLLLEYIILVLIPSKAEEYLKETYPEYEYEN